MICATGVDLRDRIREGRFLEDLYYRLNDITVRVPSLRERREDIPVLAQHFLAYYARQMERQKFPRVQSLDVLRSIRDEQSFPFSFHRRLGELQRGAQADAPALHARTVPGVR